MTINQELATKIEKIKEMEYVLTQQVDTFSRRYDVVARENYPKKESDLPSIFWQNLAVRDILSRFLEFSQSNVEAMSSLELAQKARYFCECTMWMRHLSDPSKDVFDYVDMLLRGKYNHYKFSIPQIKREVSDLRRDQVNFNIMLQRHATRSAKLGTPIPTHDYVKILIDDFDKNAAQRFSIYTNLASGNYAHYAQHVEQQILVDYEKDLDKVVKDIEEYEKTKNRKVPKKQDINFPKSVGMLDEYDFLFRLTSRFLHATPVSISTNMQRLTVQDRLIFIEYIRAKTREVLTLSDFILSGYCHPKTKILGLGRHFSPYRRKNKK